MGEYIDPGTLTPSGDRCVAELAEILRAATREHTVSAQLIIGTVTIVEGHVNRLLELIVRASGGIDTSFSRAALRALEGEIYRTWDSRLRWIADCMESGISLGDVEVQDFKSVIEVRNALVHGHGKLTSSQARSITQLVELRARLRQRLNIELVSTRLVLHTSTPDRVSAIGRAFVKYLDGRAIMEYPALKLATDAAIGR